MKFKYIIVIFFIVLLFEYSYCYQLNNGEFYSSTEYTACSNYKLIGLFTPYGTNEGFISSGNFQLFTLPNICPEVGIHDGQIVELKNSILNHPNPFNPETTIEYSIKEDSNVQIEIYNIKGQKVQTLVNEIREAGYHSVIWNGKDSSGRPVASGIYFYKMKTDNYQKIRKMVLLK
jgi:WD40 repeat protein